MAARLYAMPVQKVPFDAFWTMTIHVADDSSTTWVRYKRCRAGNVRSVESKRADLTA
jgi:hypothetical protein